MCNLNEGDKQNIKEIIASLVSMVGMAVSMFLFLSLMTAVMGCRR